MDVYPATSDVTIPSGVVSRFFRGWYQLQETPLTAVNLDALKAVRGTSGVMVEPPKADQLLLGEEPPDPQNTEIWRGILRPSLHGNHTNA